MESSVQEREFRRRWYRAHLERFRATEAAAAAASWARFRANGMDALAVVEHLGRSGDLDAFKAAMVEWSARPDTGFGGFSGQMFINQLVNQADDPAELARLLVDGFRAPADDAAAADKIVSLATFAERIRKGAHPSPGRVPFVLSYFWGLQDRAQWPIQWSTAVAYLETATGSQLPADPAGRYLAFRALVLELGVDPEEFEGVADWWDKTRPVLLDPVLVDRCAFGLGEADTSDDEALRANGRALAGIGGYIANALAEDVSRAVGRIVQVAKPGPRWKDDQPRSDLWADWRLNDDKIGLRLWVNQNGVAIGLRPGWVRKGWYDEAHEVVAANPLPGYTEIAAPWSRYGEDLGHVGGYRGEFAYSRWFGPDELGSLDVRQIVEATAAQLQPIFDKLLALAVGERPAPDDPLRPFVDEFLATRYPSPADDQHHADRDRFAGLLAADNLPLADIAELRQIWNTSRYGGPGPQSILNTSFRDADAAEYDRILRSITHLLWGDVPDEKRIDTVLEDPDYQVRGLGESVMMKLLAIANPQRYVPVFPLPGPKGKLRMLRLLGLDEPTGATRGELQTRANDLLRQRLDHFFPGDPWGMAQFLYWYDERSQEPEVEPDVDPLDQLAEELLVDRSFLDDIVGLLQDKGQVILYGPPGTGKTYLARKLAEALVPDPTRRSLVQFHPSTSYEDFFEGYRPETAPDGTMTYRLTPGPLSLLASRAAASPGKRHVMIIDEINRANLPKVFGELLFLLEYRNDQVRTLYRPEDAFELPKDLWFIGTMNTADRSIALIDAAMRRRFNFVPFFPNDGPMKGLLDRWLARAGEPAWVGELVAMVNDELTAALGGPHLQLGPSHFMRKGMDEAALHRIWRYNIEPFIEDQFFGDAGQIQYFGFDQVLARYRDTVGGELPQRSTELGGPAAPLGEDG